MCYKETETSQYDISYQPTSRGWHQLHIKVGGEHIKGSPFPVIVLKKFGLPTKTICGVKHPWGVAVNSKGDIIVVEHGQNCVSIFDSKGGIIKSFGSHGYNNGQFDRPNGVAVDASDNILVADCENHRIQKFTSGGIFITVAGKRGIYEGQFKCPSGIGVHPHTGNLFVAEWLNSCVQILNRDQTFFRLINSYGTDNGEFQSPMDVAFDSTGNAYVADSRHHAIIAFTAKGEYLRKFEKKEGNGELNRPTSISIDSDDVVYVTDSDKHCVTVFTSEEKFLTSFGTKGSKPGQLIIPHGITVDCKGVVYVTDCGNDRVQLF